MTARFIFHVAGSALADGGAGLKPYYRRLRDGLAAMGGRVEFLTHHRALVAGQVALSSDFHILDHGSHVHPRALNTGIAYLYPFWNLDPQGIRALSSIHDLGFDAGAVDQPAAATFAARQRKRLVGARSSRYPQPEAVQQMTAGAVAVFLQSDGHRLVGETCHLDRDQMLAALLARDDPAPIVIKKHPRDHDRATDAALRDLAGRDNRVRIVDANIHDMLARAKLCVTINSAVGIEAMLHRVPVVLCGKSDFHHCAVTVRAQAEMAAACDEALCRVWPFDAYLYWYFALNCLNAGSDSLVPAFLGKIAATGFEMARFGPGFARKT